MLEMESVKDKICCECGCTMQRGHLKKHLTTDKHRMFMKGASMQHYHEMIGRRARITDLRRLLERELDERGRDACSRMLEQHLKAKGELEKRYLGDTESEASV